MGDYKFRWDVIPTHFDFLMSGLQQTLLISAITLALALVGGLIIALLDLSRWRALRHRRVVGRGSASPGRRAHWRGLRCVVARRLASGDGSSPQVLGRLGGAGGHDGRAEEERLRGGRLRGGWLRGRLRRWLRDRLRGGGLRGRLRSGGL